MYKKYYFATIRLCDWFRVSTLASDFNRYLFIRSYSQLEIPMSISANFPNVFPSLELNFAQSQQLDPRVTFSRSTTAPYYDGKTSVLAEQNTTLNSSSLSGQLVLSTGSATVTYNSTTAPDGTTTATSIVPTNGATIAIYYIGNGPTNSAYSYTVSIYVKANGMNYVAIGTSNASSIVIEANLSTGVVSGGSGSVVSAGNGWYRIIATFSSYNNGTYYLQVRDTSGTTTLSTANGTNGIYVWGAQSEQRSSVTAYNATTTTPITNYIPQLLTAPINAPRFDFNPTTGESLGLLIEQSSTNLNLYSQLFDNSYWTKSNATITTAANIAPDGTQTFQKLVESATTGEHYVARSVIAVTSGISYTYSIYLKASERTRVRVGPFYGFGATGGGGIVLFVNLSNGTIISSANGTAALVTNIVSVGNSCYRVTISDTAYANEIDPQINLVSTGTTVNYTGDGYSGIYIWGAQLEALAFPTSYIPTTSAQVTRASDRNGGLSTNGWYNNGQGTFYFDFKSIYSSSLSPATTLIALGNVNTVLYTNNGGNGIYSYDGVSASSQASIPFGTRLQLAISYGVAGKQLLYNGGTVATSTYNNAFANQTNLYIGNDINGFTQINGWIKKMAYYPQQLTVAQTQALTGS